MNLQQYLGAVRNFWWVLVLTVLVGAGYGAVQAASSESTYRASVTFFVVAQATDGSTSAAVQGDQFAQRRVNSYVALLSTDRLAKRIADRPEIDLEPGAVRSMIGASGDLDTVLLTATVSSDSPDVAGAVGDAVAEEFVALVDDIENPGAGDSTVNLEVVSGPSVREVSPRTLLTVAMPATWGLLLGFAVAILLELRDQTVRTEEQLLALTSVPVLGRTPEERRIASTPLLMVEDPMSTFAEAMRQLRTNLQFLGIETPMQVIMMTSSVTEEGKSVTSANLAVSLAGAGYKTVVVDTDLRRPTVAGHFRVDRSVGLTDVLIGRSSVAGALKPWDTDLTVLSSGPLPPNPTELLAGRNMGLLIKELRERFDVIVLDTPPLLPVADAQVVSSLADGVLLAVRAGHTTRNQVTRSIRALESVSAPLLGTVLTMSGEHRRSGYSSYEQIAEAKRAPLAPRASVSPADPAPWRGPASEPPEAPAPEAAAPEAESPPVPPPAPEPAVEDRVPVPQPAQRSRGLGPEPLWSTWGPD